MENKTMTIFRMKLTTIPFEKILSGEKIIESRLYDEKRQQISLGDQIEFTSVDNPTKKFLTTIEALYLYPDFKNLFSDFPAEYFGGKSKNELLKGIETFYSKEKQETNGVVGIRLSLVK